MISRVAEAVLTGALRRPPRGSGLLEAAALVEPEQQRERRDDEDQGGVPPRAQPNRTATKMSRERQPWTRRRRPPAFLRGHGAPLQVQTFHSGDSRGGSAAHPGLCLCQAGLELLGARAV